MTDTNQAPDDRLIELIRRIDPDATLLRAWSLTGGVSAQVTGLEIARAGDETEKLIVRRHGEVDRSHNPNVARDEFALLRRLSAEGLPVPAPRYVDNSGEILGTPCVVVAFIDGSTDYAPASVPAVADELAAQLTRIHAIDPTAEDLSFLPDQAERCAARLTETPAKLDDELHEGRIRATLAAAWPLPERNRPTLLHGDFWPGNTLWLNGRLTGVIDWEDAATGDPLADLANSRLEMTLMLGPNAIQRFTTRYLALNPLDATDLPYWELCAALRPIEGMPRWGLDDATLHRCAPA